MFIENIPFATGLFRDIRQMNRRKNGWSGICMGNCKIKSRRNQ